MDKRKETILNTIVREYIRTANPVSSGVLVEKYNLNVSPATVRNDMASLEEEGFIVQPHTSAGRVPTEFAYNKYAETVKLKKIKESEIDEISLLLKEKNEDSIKKVSKILSNLSGLAVIWAFNRRNLYYTGISNFLSQPEFISNSVIYDISLIIDEMDVIIDKVFDDIEFDTSVKIGSANPFSPLCGVVLSKYKLGNEIGMFGILGPMRMRYSRNISLVKKIKEILDNN